MMTRVILLSATLSLSCVTLSRPDRREALGNVPKQEIALAAVDVLGHQVAVDVRWHDKVYAVSGELLAIDAESIWILGKSEPRATKLTRASVTRVEVELYESYAGASAAASVVGAILSPLVGGAPGVVLGIGWLVVGVTASGVAAARNDISVEPHDFDQLYQFARFPQGMPEAAPPTETR